MTAELCDSRHHFMIAKRFLFAALLVMAFGITLPIQAQPHAGYVYPAGGQHGTTVEAVIGGQFLNGATNVIASDDAVGITIVEYNRPMAQTQFNDLRDRFRALQQKRRASNAGTAGTPASQGANVWTAEDAAELEQIRARILRNPPNRQGNPAIAETLTVRIAIASNTPVSECEIRVRTQSGLSNPMLFCIGGLPEISEPREKVGDIDPNLLRQLAPDTAVSPNRGILPRRVSLPTVINGQIMPGAVDRFRFDARQGQEILFVVSARRLIPYLADAVPGWFQAAVSLVDSKGKEVGFADDYHFDPDPVLRCVIPEDGEYVLEIRDAIYRGRHDFVYRIEAGELPFVTAVFPAGGPAGTEIPVGLSGWNLPDTRRTVTAHAPGIQEISFDLGSGRCQTLPFTADMLQERVEQEPNDTRSGAQRVTWPMIVNGCIAAPGDADTFRVEGRAGDEIVAEVQARRLRSPLDSVVRLLDSKGVQLAINDDTENRGDGLSTHHSDSYLRARLPKSGTYYVEIRDARRQGGGDHVYRVRISPPKPDFELRVVPSSIVARAGIGVPITIHAVRRDGFSGDITVSLKDGSESFVLGGGVIPGGADQIRMTLTARAPLRDVIRLSMEGRAAIGGAEIVRAVSPADDRMQAFAYRHLVPAREMVAIVSGRPVGGQIRAAEQTPVRIPIGGTASVPITGASGLADRFRFELSEAPDGITLEQVISNRAGAELQVRCDGRPGRAGARGNLIVNLVPVNPGANAARPANRRPAPVGTLPAIPFELVSP